MSLFPLPLFGRVSWETGLLSLWTSTTALSGSEPLQREVWPVSFSMTGHMYSGCPWLVSFTLNSSMTSSRWGVICLFPPRLCCIPPRLCLQYLISRVSYEIEGLSLWTCREVWIYIFLWSYLGTIDLACMNVHTQVFFFIAVIFLWSICFSMTFLFLWVEAPNAVSLFVSLLCIWFLLFSSNVLLNCAK